jgi:hypothetical protein
LEEGPPAGDAVDLDPHASRDSVSGSREMECDSAAILHEGNLVTSGHDRTKSLRYLDEKRSCDEYQYIRDRVTCISLGV